MPKKKKRNIDSCLIFLYTAHPFPYTTPPISYESVASREIVVALSLPTRNSLISSAVPKTSVRGCVLTMLDEWNRRTVWISWQREPYTSPYGTLNISSHSYVNWASYDSSVCMCYRHRPPGGYRDGRTYNGRSVHDLQNRKVKRKIENRTRIIFIVVIHSSRFPSSYYPSPWPKKKKKTQKTQIYIHFVGFFCMIDWYLNNKNNNTNISESFQRMKRKEEYSRDRERERDRGKAKELE